MRDETAAAFRAALEDRLRAAAPAGDASLVRLRRLVIFDRLLARLLVVAPDRWVLKGGLALDLRLAPQARATKDMDLGHDGDEDAATSDFLDAQATDVGDLFALAIERTDNRDAALEGNAVRYRISARLAGRRFGEAIVDVGFGDPPVADPDVLEGPRLLAFAGFEPIRVPALPLERHVAEKVHAYTRPYPGQRRSSRVKDLVDLVLIRSAAAVDAGRLREAIGGTFAQRGTHAVPTALPPPPPDWGPAYRATAAATGLDPDLVVGHRLAASFLDPVLGDEVADGARWEPTRGAWESDGA